MRKIITFGILILFVLSCFLPLVIGFSSEAEGIYLYKSGCQAVGDIIIVDDEGDGNYIWIKDALDHANPGDTIKVYSGTYAEHTIIINKEEITLIGISHEFGGGNDIGKPFIDGPGTDQEALIDIKSDYVTINGFRIENSGGPYGNVIISISEGADGCIISNNDIAHSTCSCIWNGGSDNKILKNNISHSVIRNGIHLHDPCNNSLVLGNIISDVESGILCWDSNNNTITGNKISRCSRFGIDLASSDYNTIEGNSIEDNFVGLDNYFSVGCKVNNNNFINNQEQVQVSYGRPIFRCFTNRWDGNYWNRSRLLPYPIRGGFLFIPLVQFDWHPAKEPYDI